MASTRSNHRTDHAVLRAVHAVPLSAHQDPLRALIFDSYYDPYRGVVCQYRVVDGKVSRGDTVVMMNTGKEYTLDEIGVLAPVKTPVRKLLLVIAGLAGRAVLCVVRAT